MLIVVFMLTTACSGNPFTSRELVFVSQPVFGSGAETETTVAGQENSETTANPIEVDYDSDDLDAASEDVDTIIRLNGDSISVNGSGATVDGSVVTISAAGTYSINGTLNNGQIIVNTEDQKKVKLVLNGAAIASSTSDCANRTKPSKLVFSASTRIAENWKGS